MTPARRSSRAPHATRERREVQLAALAAAVIIGLTVLLVWALGPHESDAPSSPSPRIETPTSTGSVTTVPTTSGPTTSAPGG